MQDGTGDIVFRARSNATALLLLPQKYKIDMKITDCFRQAMPENCCHRPTQYRTTQHLPPDQKLCPTLTAATSPLKPLVLNPRPGNRIGHQSLNSSVNEPAYIRLKNQKWEFMHDPSSGGKDTVITSDVNTRAAPPLFPEMTCCYSWMPQSRRAKEKGA